MPVKYRQNGNNINISFFHFLNRYGWLHYGFKENGNDSIIPSYSMGHFENYTGTSKRYVPYSTVKPKMLLYANNSNNSKYTNK